MNQLFNYNNNNVRAIVKDDDILFCCKDICNILGIEKHRDTLARVPTQWTGSVRLDTVKGLQTFGAVTESGLYYIVMRSNKDEAIKFQQWICGDVIPSIRKTGKYELVDKKPKFKNLTFKIETEYDLHKKVINYIKNNFDDVLINATLGEMQTDERKRITCNLMGYQSGSPDIIIEEISAKYSGFAIEFKSPSGNGTLSDAQNKKLAQYKERNFKVMVSNDYDEIIISLYDYLNNRRLQCRHCVKRFKSVDTLKNHYRVIHRNKIHT